MKLRKLSGTIPLAVLLLMMCIGPSSAEVTKVTVARQYGLQYIPIMIMMREKLFEKHARNAGLADLEVNWVQLGGAAAMNDALLAGNAHYVIGGVPPYLILWDRTRRTPTPAKAIAALNYFPIFLVTRNPNVKTIRDFTERDRIALPAIKISTQAIILQMAAEKEFGESGRFRLDPLTVAMSVPDGLTALLSGKGDVTSYFGQAPFQYQALQQPGIRLVLNSYDVLGGPATLNVIWTTERFYQDNPKINAAFYAALEEAIAMTNGDKRRAAQVYLEITGDKKNTVNDIVKTLNDPQIGYSTTPMHVMKFVDFLHRIGTLKNKPTAWKDVFLPAVHHLPGS